MSELSDLYQEVILDHNRRPRNFRVLDGATHKAEGSNPLCGDRLELFLTVDDGVITDVGLLGSKGCPVIDACTLFERFHRMVTTPPDVEVEDLGKLSAFAGVRQFPVRVKCASLAWHTLKAALNQKQKTTTE